MRFSLFSTLSLISAVCAGPIGEHLNALENRNGYTNQVASSDNLKPTPVVVVNKIPVPYKGLNYTRYTTAYAGTLGLDPGVVPESPDNYAVFSIVQELQAPNLITTAGTPTTRFDLSYFYFGCLVGDAESNAQLATSCTILVTPSCRGVARAGRTIRFVPSSVTNAKVSKATFGAAFKGITEVEFTILASGATLADNVFLLDNCTYTTYP